MITGWNTTRASSSGSNAPGRACGLGEAEACAVQRSKENFIALEWPGRTIGQSLAAMLEKGTSYPMQIGWGDYLLRAAIARECATRLITGGPAPQGYLIYGNTPWDEIISDGVRQGVITLRGEAEAMVIPARPALIGIEV